VSDDDRPVWRASLQDAGTGKRTGFAGLEELFDFLQRETGLLSDEKTGQAKANN